MRAEREVVEHIDHGDEAARRALAAAAAQALEACATTWQAFGAVAGPRQLHLVHRLEDRLAEHQRAVQAGEASHRVNRRAVTVPARAARLATERLRRGSDDVVRDLSALEEGALALAASAIRAVENIGATGHSNGRLRRAAPPAAASLQARFVEIHMHAESLSEPRHRGDLATWLSECLVMVTPAVAAERWHVGGSRRSWLRLGARELLIARSLAQPPSPRVLACSSEMVCAVAADVLADTGLAASPNTFDALTAWDHQVAALSPLVPACARALSGDQAAADKAHAVLVHRLARIVSALWLIDHRSPAPRSV
jgi:hypothetical protein